MMRITTMNTPCNIPAPTQFITDKAKMTTFQQPEHVHWCAKIDWLDQLSTATDRYFNMMAHANAYQLTALQQLMH